jgi:hypothetical protein
MYSYTEISLQTRKESSHEPPAWEITPHSDTLTFQKRILYSPDIEKHYHAHLFCPRIPIFVIYDTEEKSTITAAFSLFLSRFDKPNEPFTLLQQESCVLQIGQGVFLNLISDIFPRPKDTENLLQRLVIRKV